MMFETWQDQILDHVCTVTRLNIRSCDSPTKGQTTQGQTTQG